MFIRDVVGQFEFMESNRLGHPLLAGGRAVRVDIHPLGHLRVGLARHHPTGVVELVAAVVRGHDVQQQDVFGFFIQSVYPHFERREHPPAETNKATQSQRRDSNKTGREMSTGAGTNVTEAPVEAETRSFWTSKRFRRLNYAQKNLRMRVAPYAARVCECVHCPVSALQS